MIRYHTVSGTGTGVGQEIKKSHIGAYAMWQCDGGHWVKYDDALAYGKEQWQAGHDAGTSLRASVRTYPPAPELTTPPVEVKDADGWVWCEPSKACPACIARRAKQLKDKETGSGSCGVDLETQLKAARDQGYADGYQHAMEATGWTKCVDTKQGFLPVYTRELTDPVPTGSWTPPGVALRGTAADVQVPLSDTRTNQLLNELYHDRARLERVVKQAVELVKRTAEIAEENSWTDDDGENVYENYPLSGAWTEFVDSHGE